LIVVPLFSYKDVDSSFIPAHPDKKAIVLIPVSNHVFRKTTPPFFFIVRFIQSVIMVIAWEKDMFYDRNGKKR